jgi:hypothetical protein
MKFEIGKKYRNKITNETGVCVGFGTFTNGDSVLIDVVTSEGKHDQIWLPAPVAEEAAS